MDEIVMYGSNTDEMVDEIRQRYGNFAPNTSYPTCESTAQNVGRWPD